jgi:hypothetical protein
LETCNLITGFCEKIQCDFASDCPSEACENNICVTAQEEDIYVITENNPPVWSLETEAILVVLDPEDANSLIWKQNYAENVTDID